MPSFSHVARVRFAVAAGALGYAALAIGIGLDRLAVARSYGQPRVASHVPALFATNALEVIGEADLRSDPHAATGLAQRLVARAPIEPSSTALLGAARGASGDYAGADRAFRVAGQLGWRIPLTQSYWLYASLNSGDTRVAALRLDALLRQRPELLRLPATLAPFENTPAAHNALNDRLVNRPPWLSWYDGQVDPVPAGIIARRAPSLIMLGDRGIVLGCDAIAPAVRKLVSAGLTVPALALQRRHCPVR